MKTLTWITDRLKERSTWIGLSGIVTAAGVAISPELLEAIISMGIAAASLIAIITKDKKDA